MQRYVMLEIKRALLTPVFLAGLFVVAIMIIVWASPAFSSGQSIGSRALVQYMIRDGYLAILGPLLATLPFAQSYAIERNTGFSQFVMQRFDVQWYRLLRLLSNGLAGGLTLALPVAGMVLWISIQTPIVPDYGGFIAFFGNGWTPAPPLYMVLTVAVAFLFGFTYATLGLAASVLFRNPFYANVIPFALYLVGGVIVAVSALLFGLNSLTVLLPTAMWDPSITLSVTPFSFAFQYLIILLVSIIFYVRYFRLREG